MTENDVKININKLKSTKVKVIANTAINFLARHIEVAIKIREFFEIDYEKYGKEIIMRANISTDEKEKIRNMFEKSHEMLGEPKPNNQTQNDSNIQKDKLKISSPNTNITTKETNTHSPKNNKIKISNYLLLLDIPLAEEKIIDLNSFIVQEKIYRGDYCKIYKIYSNNTKQIFVAKQQIRSVDDYTRSKLIDFIQEVNISLKLNYPSIVKYIGYSPVNYMRDKIPMLVSEYVSNKSLENLFESINNNIQIPNWNDTKKLINIYGIASAMHYMHSNNLIYCNLQPNNILLDDLLYPKICDFESAKDLTIKKQLNDSKLRNNPIYTAPETYFDLNYSKSSDVYAFAFIVYEIITGKKPFNNYKNSYEIMIDACKKGIRPEFNEPIDDCYRRLIEKCWSQKPTDRPSFTDILNDLETDTNLITENISKEEYYNYIKLIKKSKLSLDPTLNIQDLDNILQYKTNQFEKKHIGACLNPLKSHLSVKMEYRKSYNIDETKKLIAIYGITAIMNFLHSQDMIHRDLKSDNVELDFCYLPNIKGFDIAMFNSKDKKVICNNIKGTAAYLAPEVFEKKEYSEKSDVYSYSLVLYEIITEKEPFEGYSNAFEIEEEICKKKSRPEFQQPINKEYRQLIERCWSQNPQDRPTFSEILIELETNDKYITFQIDKQEYHQCVNYIKETKSFFDKYEKIISSKRSQVLGPAIYNVFANMLSQQSKTSIPMMNLPQWFTDNNENIDVNFKGAFETDTSRISFKPIYSNLKDFIEQKYIGEKNDYQCFEVCEIKSDDVYMTKTPYQTISEMFQSQFENFLNELNILLQIDHPCILKFIGFSPIGFNKPYKPLFITEYASRGTLSQYLKLDKKMDPKVNLSETQKLIIIYGIAAGMNYLHSNNIIHRDLKSDNIELDFCFYPKITGFDIAIELPKELHKDKKITFNKIKGTVAYLAPEVFKNKEYSDKSDVYSYSLLLYEILTEKQPFEYSDENGFYVDLYYFNLLPKFQQPINIAYQQLIERCCSPNPLDRPSFSEILTELETNEKIITDKINKKEYQKYIHYIKNTKSMFKSFNKIENLQKYIDFHIKEHKDFDQTSICKRIYQTETNQIKTFNCQKNIKNYIKKRLVFNDKYHCDYELFDKDQNSYCIGRILKIQLDCNSIKKLYNFAREINTISGLYHPAILAKFGYSLTDLSNHHFPIVFYEYSSNSTLYHFIESECNGYNIEEFDDTRKLIIIYGIALGMKYLHENDVICGYLKPQSILINNYLFPKIIVPFNFIYHYDFDLDNEKVQIDYYQMELYSDPAIDNFKFTKASDVFSFALIIYEILMNKKITFDDANSESDIVLELLDGNRPEFDEHVPLVFQDLISRCWKENGNERPTFDEIVEELENNPKFFPDSINKTIFDSYVRYINTDHHKHDEYQEYKIEFPQISKPLKFFVNLEYADLTKYQKENQIGKGGFGSVYKVIDKESGDVYAAKTSIYEIEQCEDYSIQNLSREIEIISQLNHPTILKFIGFNSQNFKLKPKPTIITEFAPNGSLDQIIELERNNCSHFDWDDTKKLINMYGIAVGMKYLHDKSIIHRDLKPANIFLDEFLYPKIGDFGLSRDVHSGVLKINIGDFCDIKTPVHLSYENKSKENSGYKGTIVYSSPEIIKKGEYSEKGDVYAYGLIVYEIMTNEIPYEGMNQYQVLAEKLKEFKPIFKYPIPYCYKNLIKKCLLQDPDYRPSFEKIVSKFERNAAFITQNVDKEEFYNYISYVKQISHVINNERKQQKNSSNKSVNDPNRIKIKEDSNSINNISFLDLENYKKISDISKSDFYKVSKVQEIKSGLFYAAKESMIRIDKISEDELFDLQNEIKVIIKINHPLLLKFIGYSPINFKKESKPVFITELTSNGSLSTILRTVRKGGSVSGWNDTKKLINIYGIAKGMAYLHSMNILHRNLKTENIFIDENFYPKISDFGLSGKISIMKSLSYQSTSGIKGIPAYISPEMILSNSYSKSSDVYSFAFIVYEIMYNEIPFKGLSINQIFNEIINGNRPEFYKSIPLCYTQLIEDVLECYQMHSNAITCTPMLSDAIRCARMLFQKNHFC